MYKMLSGLICALLFFVTFVTPSVQAAEACWFGLVACDEDGIVWEIEPAIENQATAIAYAQGDFNPSTGVGGLIVSVTEFIGNVLLPTLLAVAFFVFLYSIVRFLIIDQSNQDGRSTAKRYMIYSIAAFVLIASIWGIVNVLVSGLRIDRTESLCPDYLGTFCSSFASGVGSESDVSFGNTGNTNGGQSGTGDGQSGGVVNPGTGSQITVKLGELLLGAYEDNHSHSFISGAPRAAGTAALVSSNASCIAGLDILRQSSLVENTQSAFALYRDNGSDRWVNLTDATTRDSITFDMDTYSQIETSGVPILVHTHPQSVITALNLPMSGHAPSIDDMKALCSSYTRNIPQVIVAGSDLWLLGAQPSLCPRSSAERDRLTIISLFLQLAVMDPSVRNTEFTAFREWRETPRDIQILLESYATTDWSDLSQPEIIVLANDLARADNMSIQKLTPTELCSLQ